MTARIPDLVDPDLFRREDPTAAFAHLREHDPVHWQDADGGGFWNLTRYGDVRDALTDHRWLSSRDGAIAVSSYRARGDSASGKMLVASDLPEHRSYRRVFLGALGSEALDGVRRQLHRLLDRELTRLLDDGGGDFARAVSRQVPVAALMSLLAVSETEAGEIVDLTDAVVGYRDPTLSDLEVPEDIRLAAAQIELLGLLDELVERRRKDPGDDTVSRFVAAESASTLDPAEVLYNLVNLVFGGNETSAHTASGAMQMLMYDEPSYDALVADPGRVPVGLLELLRLTSVAAYVKRVATEDRTVHGTRIHAGQTVMLWLFSANRDPEVFEDPLALLLTRAASGHQAFGLGIHRCVGANVALVELETLFTRLMTLTGRRLRPAGPAVRLRSNFIRGFTSMPVVVA